MINSICMKLMGELSNCGLVNLPRIEDGKDGVLSVAECSKQIPFDIKRVYYIYDLHDKSAVRGKHAHKHNEQIIFCINGSFTLMLDDGTHTEEVVLDKPNVGVYMGVKLWHTMSAFSSNCILLVFASDLYDESDYIRKYDEFKEYIAQ